jgi:hypothetical protein
MPDGRVVLWSADGTNSFSAKSPKVHMVVYDPLKNTHVYKVIAIPHNMFCTGTTMLPDGRVLVNGGNQGASTSIFSPSTLSFSSAQAMKISRGYNANTLLPDGSVLTIGGSWKVTLGGKIGEIYTAAAGWRTVSGLQSAPMEMRDPSKDWALDSHYWLIPTGNGRVFHAGPSFNMHWLNVRDSGSVVPAGRRGDDTFAINGSAVMYDTGKVLKAGGATAYTNTASSRNTYLIGLSGRLSVKKTTPLIFPRGYANSVVLPDGKVMFVGGQTFVKEFSDAGAVLIPELYDPVREMSAPLAPHAVARTYHSVALLLPDARVLSSGGGLCGGCNANHPDLQVFSPPYLFNASGAPAVRPKILSAPAAVEYGRQVSVRTDVPVRSFAMIRLSAVTHTVNNDQRRMVVTHTSSGNNTYTLNISTNPGWLLPGYWMLFAINDAGTPSVAHTVQVKTNRTVDIVGPVEIKAKLGSPVSVGLKWKSLGPSVSFSASGLPSGLAMNSATGTISGTPKVKGTFLASLRGAGPQQTIGSEFIVQVD